MSQLMGEGMALTTRERWCIAATIIVCATAVVACAVTAYGFEQDRTAYVPFQPPWMERNQTLVGGIFAGLGGILAIGGGLAMAYGQIQAAEIANLAAQFEIRARTEQETGERLHRARIRKRACRMQTKATATSYLIAAATVFRHIQDAVQYKSTELTHQQFSYIELFLKELTGNPPIRITDDIEFFTDEELSTQFNISALAHNSISVINKFTPSKWDESIIPIDQSILIDLNDSFYQIDRNIVSLSEIGDI